MEHTKINNIETIINATGLNNVFTYHNYHATYNQNTLKIYNNENELIHSEVLQNFDTPVIPQSAEAIFHSYIHRYNNSDLTISNVYSSLDKGKDD